MTTIVEQPDSVYLGKTNTYFQSIGTKEFFWTRIQPQTPNLNGQDRTIRFNEPLTEFFYNISEAGVMLTFHRTNAAGVAQPSGIPDVTPLSDTFFNFIESRIGSVDIASGYGSKNYLHKAAHLTKLFYYSPEYAKQVAGNEYFYPDTGSTAGTHTQSLLVKSTGALNTTPVAQTSDSTNLDYGSVTAPALYAGTEYVGPFGHHNFRIDKNYKYNDGHVERLRFISSNEPSGQVTVWIPLKYYIPALEVFKTVMSGFRWELNLRRPPPEETMFGSTVQSDLDAGVYSVTADGYKLFIDQADLYIPTYDPRDFMKARILTALSSGISEVRQYMDLDVIESSTLFAPNSTSTRHDFLNVLDRPPVAAFLGFQFDTDAHTQRGNIHRYFNPGVTSAQLQIGNGQLFPRVPFETNPDAKDYRRLYNEFLRVTNLTKQTARGNLISYDDFVNHKFLIPFDLTEIKEDTYTPGMIQNIKLTINHKDISALFNYPSTTGSIDMKRTGLADQALANVSFPIDGSAPGGNYRLVLFLFVSRAIKIDMRNAGISIENNVPPRVN